MKYSIGQTITLLNGIKAVVIGKDEKKKIYTVILGTFEYKIKEKSVKHE